MRVITALIVWCTVVIKLSLDRIKGAFLSSWHYDQIKHA